MAYTNSPLVDYKKISPNRTKNRNHKIDTITIHCVVGQVSVKTLGSIFASSSRQASSNYGVGYDGKIGMYVEEKDRSWCSSSRANDHRAITIEVASDTKSPYKVTAKAYAALLDLVTDICKRNDIKELKWKADKSLIGQVDKQNMTVHRWFANKSCPGNYLYNRMDDIAAEVNKRLNAIVEPEVTPEVKPVVTPVAPTPEVEKPTVETFKPYKVRVTASALNVRKGAGTKYGVATVIRDKGVYTIIKETDGWGKLKSGAGWISLKYTKKI